MRLSADWLDGGFGGTVFPFATKENGADCFYKNDEVES